jgi:hypothetical protein
MKAAFSPVDFDDLLGPDPNEPLNRPIRLTRFPSQAATKRKELELSLRGLAAEIEAAKADSKTQLPWLKGALFGKLRTPLRPRADGQGMTGNSLRHNANVLTVTALETDYDAGTITPQEARDRLEKAGITGLVYTTPSHLQPGKGSRWRTFVPLSRELRLDGHDVEWLDDERKKLVARLNGLFGGALDGASFVLSQAFFYGNVTGQTSVQTFLVEGRRFIDQAADLDTTARGKELRQPGDNSGGDSVDSAGLSEAELLELIASGASYHEAIMALARRWAWIGVALEDIASRLQAAMEQVPTDQRDQRWKDRRAELLKCAQDGRDYVERERARVRELFDDLGPEPEADKLVGGSITSTLRGLSLAELRQLPAAFDFVEGVLYEDTVSMIYGQRSSLKTFIALDLALHIAAGRPWHGQETERSGVIYIALEGGRGIKHRLNAWLTWHRLRKPDTLPMAFAEGGLDLRNDKGTLAWIIAFAKAKAIEWGLPVRWIVIDTLSKAMAGGDENGADMTALVDKADEIRRATGASVSLIHHEGKDGSRGARGHSSLGGNIDTELRVVREGNRSIVTLGKQRDGPDGLQWGFKREMVELGYADARGKPMSSLVVVPDRLDAFTDARDEKLTARQREALQVLRRLISEHANWTDEGGQEPCPTLAQWRAALSDAGWPFGQGSDKSDRQLLSESSFRRAADRVKNDLAEQKLISIEDDKVRLLAQ